MAHASRQTLNRKMIYWIIRLFSEQRMHSLRSLGTGDRPLNEMRPSNTDGSRCVINFKILNHDQDGSDFHKVSKKLRIADFGCRDSILFLIGTNSVCIGTRITHTWTWTSVFIDRNWNGRHQQQQKHRSKLGLFSGPGENKEKRKTNAKFVES